MGYDHSMNAHVQFKPGVTVTQAIAALQPLSRYQGWDDAELISGAQLAGDDSVTINQRDGYILSMSIYSAGDVGHGYYDLVEEFAQRLEHIAEAGSIELRDHDTADLENAISTMWYGDPVNVAAAQRAHAWHQAQELLRAAGVAETLLQAVNELAGRDEAVPPPAGEQPEVGLLLVDEQKRNTVQAENASVPAAIQFINDLAGLSIWSYDRKDGTPYVECAAPSDGFLDSHTCLMDLIEQARSIGSAASAASISPGSRWDDNAVQFPRLLCEIQATQELDWPALTESMDVERSDLDELFERANSAWESAKADTPRRTVSVIGMPATAPDHDGREFLPGADVQEVGSVMMQDVVGDYDVPDTVPEWSWVVANASFAHVSNGTDGVWDFVLNLSYDFNDVPEKLQPVLNEAYRKHLAYLIFHQGT